MADVKISAEADGNPPQDADLSVWARGAGNVRLSWLNIRTALAALFEPVGAIAAHEAAADPHIVYQKESEKGAANGYAGLDAGAKVPTAQLGSGVADATTFLRGDQSYASPGAGSTNIKSIEIDFGAVPTNYGIFAIADGAVSAASNIGMWLSMEAPTGRDADEAEMEPMDCQASDMAAGAFNAVVQIHDGPVEGKYKLNYLVG